jgi:hypothetical protein
MNDRLYLGAEALQLKMLITFPELMNLNYHFALVFQCGFTRTWINFSFYCNCFKLKFPAVISRIIELNSIGNMKTFLIVLQKS